ncbi:MAG TPA: DMT family transporter [Trebonia sp.]|nr:DMT family transporter [Trebonia sp.]
MTYLLAVLAACANATSSVLQRKAGRKVPQGQNLSPRLIWSLLHEPVWFGGILAVTAGFLLQAAALGNGQLSVVEPILVIELPLALLLATRVFHARLHRREWGSAAAMAAGLAAMLYSLSPSGGRPESVRWYGWVIGIGANLAVIAAMVAWGRRGPAGKGPRSGQSSARQAAVLAVGAGAGFGLTAALIKGMTSKFAQGWGALLTSWQVYGMIVAGVLAMFLVQSALNAGRLVAAQPGLTLTDPIVSILWGVLVFREQVRTGWFLAVTVAGGLVVVGAVLVLARSPLLSNEPDESDEPDEPDEPKWEEQPGENPVRDCPGSEQC